MLEGTVALGAALPSLVFGDSDWELVVPVPGGTLRLGAALPTLAFEESDWGLVLPVMVD